MMEHVKDKVQLKGSKGERLIRRQLETARDELHDEATLCIFRLKSLKEGQARSLLTQAARHHTAQVPSEYDYFVRNRSAIVHLVSLMLCFLKFA